MKKFFVSLVMLLSLSAASVFAQSSLIATLSHEGEITAFYGADALKEAHEAAAHGDAITLSSGAFHATDITKAITLCGAGMQMDTVNNVLPTIISGGFTIQIANDVTEKLTLEGCYYNGTITLKDSLKAPRFVKNRFARITTVDSNDGCIVNGYFLHCKITDGLILHSKSDCTLHSCYIYKYYQCSSMQFFNCILQMVPEGSGGFMTRFDYCWNYSFYNCILIGCNFEGDYLNPGGSTTAYNNVAVNCGDDCFKKIPNTTNKTSTISEVFKDFTWEYNDNITFELTDEAKVKYLGLDDTQVGIYGGNYPYDPTTTNPHITKCNVAAKSTADGKLSVDIEVAGVE